MAKVLLLEDNQIEAKMLTQTLETEGHEVKWVTNGFYGLDYLNSASCDLIITDINMANMNGYRFLKSLKTSQMIASCPIIVCSGNNKKDEIERAIENGASDYLVKPIDIALFLTKVRKFINPPPENTKNFRTIFDSVAMKLESSVKVFNENELIVISSTPFIPGITYKASSPGFTKLGFDDFEITAKKTEFTKNKYEITFEYLNPTKDQLKKQWIPIPNVSKSDDGPDTGLKMTVSVPSGVFLIKKKTLGIITLGKLPEGNIVELSGGILEALSMGTRQAKVLSSLQSDFGWACETEIQEMTTLEENRLASFHKKAA